MKSATDPRHEPFIVYVGTYTEYVGPLGRKSEGIYVYRMDPVDGILTEVSVMKGIINPSFIALHPNGQYLYAVNELGEFNGQPGGGVSAFSIDPWNGGLKLLNQQLSHGIAPCHVCVEATGQFALVANFGGSVAVLPIEPDGKLCPASNVVEHQGEAHAHSVIMDPTNRIAIVPDLGIDKLMVYRFNPDVPIRIIRQNHGRLVPHTTPWVYVRAGAGPRHLDFHPNGRYVYLINELNSTMIAYSYDLEEGRLQELQMVPTLPERFTDGVLHCSHNACADIHVAPSGKFVYGSNRGHDSIVIYAIDESTGNLSYVGHESTLGKNPRNFAIDPTGNFLLAANQDSSTIVTFRIDPETGQLSPTGQVKEVPTPVCIKFMI